jgi:cytochrome c
MEKLAPGGIINAVVQAEEGDIHVSLKTAVAALPFLITVSLAAQAQPAVDVGDAEKLAKKSGCTKCHAVSAKKEGPPFKETAAKYQGKADAEQKLFAHLTSNPKIKVDGKEELHDSPKTKDEAQVRNLVRYILTR